MGWLYSRRTFSFGRYHDPEYVTFGPLRALNEERIQPGGGFFPHGHRNMEILSYVLEGVLEHSDSVGSRSTLRAGEVQIMSAGTGIRHSEFNHSRQQSLHFLQIWIVPDREGISPTYQHQSFAADEKRGRLRLIGSADGRDGSVVIHQDVQLFAATLNPGESVVHRLAGGRKAWLQVARGALRLNTRELTYGDGVALAGEPAVSVTGASDGAEVLLFDLP